MKIAGVQPLSLIDYPGRPCAILFTQGCVFRCSYCHNPDLIPVNVAEEKTATMDEVLPRLKKRQAIVSAVCITGGEPTLHPGLFNACAQLKEAGFSLKLDTNGINPERVRTLIKARLLDYIAMDIKHVWDRYGEVGAISRPEMIERCRETCALIQDSDVEHEFRTTIHPTAHARDDFFTIAGYLKEGTHYYIQPTRFTTMLDPSLPQMQPCEPAPLIDDLRAAFPSLFIYER